MVAPNILASMKRRDVGVYFVGGHLVRLVLAAIAISARYRGENQ